MRIIFAGTPEAAVPTLEALLGSRHQVVAVLTRPPARAGRGRARRPSAVAAAAGAHGVPLIEASTFRAGTAEGARAREAVREAAADLGVVVAYGALIPPDVLDLPRLGWVNLHFSDLPRWRGAAPVQWAVLSGDAATASSVFRLEAGLDTGPVLSRIPVAIGHETSGELLARMSVLGAAQVVDVADALEDGTVTAVAQDVGPGGRRVTHAGRLTPRDGFIDFSGTAEEADRRIRAVTPNPGAWTTLPDGRRLKLGPVDPADGEAPPGPAGTLAVRRRSVEVACGAGSVRLGRVAPAGRGWMEADAWARGARLDAGARLGATADPADEGDEEGGR